MSDSPRDDAVIQLATAVCSLIMTPYPTERQRIALARSAELAAKFFPIDAEGLFRAVASASEAITDTYEQEVRMRLHDA